MQSLSLDDRTNNDIASRVLNRIKVSVRIDNLQYPGDPEHLLDDVECTETPMTEELAFLDRSYNP